MHDTPATAPFKFDPARPVSDLAARLLAVSNAFHSHPNDGPPAAEPGTTRHAGFRYSKDPR